MFIFYRLEKDKKTCPLCRQELNFNLNVEVQDEGESNDNYYRRLQRERDLYYFTMSHLGNLGVFSKMSNDKKKIFFKYLK